MATTKASRRHGPGRHGRRPDRVVEVAGVAAVDGDQRQVAQIGPLAGAAGRAAAACASLAAEPTGMSCSGWRQADRSRSPSFQPLDDAPAAAVAPAGGISKHDPPARPRRVDGGDPVLSLLRWLAGCSRSSGRGDRAETRRGCAVGGG
jgi:hypothetical protein